MELSKIRLLRDDVSIWLLYAGRNRRFLDDFRSSRRIFLNIPGFNGAEAVFESPELIRRHLSMSYAIQNFWGGNGNAPSRNPGAHSPYPFDSGSTEARSMSADVGNVMRLFVDAKVGDLVISPGKGQYDPFLVGEITTNWSKDDDLNLPAFGEELVPTRRVRWLNVALARRDFPVKTAKALHNRHAIVEIDPEHYATILDNVYPSYIWGNRSKLDLFGDGYNGKDPMQPFEAAKLLKYVMSSVFAFEDGNIADFQSLSIDDAIREYFDEDRVIDLYQNFNSPGKFTIIGGPLLALLTAAGLKLATEDHADFNAQKVHVSQQISGSLSGPNKPVKQEIMNNYLSSLESVPWSPVQQNLGRPAQAKLGLSLSNNVEVARHRAELDGQ